MSIYRFNGWLYDTAVQLFTLGSEKPFMQRAISNLGLRDGDRVLDWGCGTGIGLQLIGSQLREGRIFAVDRSPTMAKYAVARAKPNHSLDYHFVLREGIETTIPERVNAAVAAYSLCVLPAHKFDEALRNIWELTRSGGKLLIIETQLNPSTSVVGLARQWMTNLAAAIRR